ncbi:MAG: DNA mismatch repair endonuclease MutL [Ruminococcaceae bacterium]|nr:DNA mismatch repair endonuclease MutL [Oscillospiraceae bacterium]
MPNIIQLDPHIADLIAAGEVVERPGSVVKELVENSIDAGATAITVEIQNGGLSYIRITDNGCGIPKDQAATAFLRHATSKLRTADDLSSIGTLGFRGEALAAISAVSKIDLLTRAAGETEGISLYLEAGEVLESVPAGCPEGTTIIVRELFYNTPARLKFMKKDSAEAGFISTVVTKLALSRPDVSFKLIKDGKEDLHTPGDGKLDSAVYSVMGRDFAMSSLKCHGVWNDITVTGIVSGPTASRGNRGWQYFFVNGRSIKSTTLQAALEQAYKNRIMTGRFPACVLHIELSLSAVDVNVHPAKTEVKFMRDKDIFDAVYYAVMAALGAETGRPEVKFQSKPQADSFFKTMSAEQYKEKFSGKTSTAAQSSAVPQTGPVKKETPIPIITERAVPTVTISDSARSPFGEIRIPKPTEPQKPAAPEVAPVVNRQISPVIQPENPVVIKAPVPADPVPEPQQISFDPESDVPYFRVIGEAHKTYIIVEQTEGILLIDKHAAHERILFNKYKKDASAIISQNLLMPVIFSPRGEDADALLSNIELLESFGYDISDFGGGSIVVRSVPADIDGSDCEAALCEMAEALIEGRRLDPAELRDELLHTLACRSAIKAGDVSGQAELEAITRRVLTDPDVRYCPHGRPVAVEMSKTSIEKQFKRI